MVNEPKLDLKRKKVSVQRLKMLSNELLELRIKENTLKIKKKQEYYQSLHAINLERLKAYVQYRKEDEEACRKILQERLKANTEKK